MVQLGRIDKYDEKAQNLKSYLERFEHLVIANDVKVEKNLAVFLAVIGAQAYEVLKGSSCTGCVRS